AVLEQRVMVSGSFPRSFEDLRYDAVLPDHRFDGGGRSAAGEKLVIECRQFLDFDVSAAIPAVHIEHRTNALNACRPDLRRVLQEQRQKIAAPPKLEFFRA